MSYDADQPGGPFANLRFRVDAQEAILLQIQRHLGLPPLCLAAIHIGGDAYVPCYEADGHKGDCIAASGRRGSRLKGSLR